MRQKQLKYLIKKAKILINLYPNNNYFSSTRNYDNTKPYQKKDFVRNIFVPDEADIIEQSLHSGDYEVDENNVYEAFGKLFENANMFDKAKIFFIKNFENLTQKSAPQNEINAARLDIDRVTQKADSLDIEA